MVKINGNVGRNHLAYLASVKDGISELVELESIPAGHPINSTQLEKLQLEKLISSQKLDAADTEYCRRLNVSSIGDVSLLANPTVTFSDLGQKEQIMVMGIYNLGCNIPTGLVRRYEERLLPTGYSGSPLPEIKHPDENDEALASCQSGLIMDRAKYSHEQQRKNFGRVIYVLNKDDESLTRKPL
jgi:hypothetical protein